MRTKTLNVEFSAENYRVLIRAKAKCSAETGVDQSWHDALLHIAKLYSENAEALERKPRRRKV